MKTKLTALAVTTALVAPAAIAQEMTIVSWGGAYSKSQLKAYHEPYSAKTGVKIINDESSAEAVAKLRAMNEAGNVTWDVVDVELSDAIRACDEGLLEEIDHSSLPAAPDGTPAVDDFLPGTLHDCAVANIVWSSVYVYDSSKVRNWNAPKTMADFFNTEAYPGKRGMRKSPKVTMEFALIADGVPVSEIYDVLGTEEGIERAFAKLDTIKDDVIWWSAGADTPQLLADGEVIMGSTYNGRLFSVIEEQNQPVAMLWDWQMFDLDGWIIPTGLSPERQARAMDYIMFATDTQRLADQAKYISYGPARKSSAPLVGKHADLGIEMAPHMPTDPKNSVNTFLYNYEFWADYRDDIDAKWQAWLSK